MTENKSDYLCPNEFLTFNKFVRIPEFGVLRFKEVEHPTISRIRVFESTIHASLAYAYDMYRLAVLYKGQRFNLPSGETQKMMYKFLPTLVSTYKYNPFLTIRVSPLDEYTPISPNHRNSFTLYHNKFIGQVTKNIDHINGRVNAQGEVERLNAMISADPGVISAFGTDDREGHIAFIPPGTPFSTRGYTYVELTDATYERDRLERNQDSPRGAITQTFNTVFDAKHLLVAGWNTKGNTFKRAFKDNEATEDIPLSIMQLPEIGQKATIYMDFEAGLRYLYPNQANILFSENFTFTETQI